jgi:hypothetical protein
LFLWFVRTLLNGDTGKKTRVSAVLREVYGPSVEKVTSLQSCCSSADAIVLQQVKIEQRKFVAPGKSKPIELTTLASSHHIEMNPSDAGSSDRAVIQEVIKEMAASVPLDATVPFKVDQDVESCFLISVVLLYFSLVGRVVFPEWSVLFVVVSFVS